MEDHGRLEDDLTPTEFLRIELKTGWEFKQVGAIGVPEPTDEFAPVAQFPTNIHLDLELHKRIPDPFMGLNEYKVQWVGEQQWLYKTDFDIQTKPGHLEKLVLQFDGLDTFADVKVNGIPVLTANNMHRTYRVEINDQVQIGTNILEILFDSAVIRGKQLMDDSGFKPGVTPQSTDPSRLVVRKAQYHYGWNWGPELMTCGPWRPIYLDRYSARISELSASIDISVKDKSAAVTVTGDIEGAFEGDTVIFTLIDPDGQFIETSDPLSIVHDSASTTFNVHKAKFWCPTGYGKQPLYTVGSKLIRKALVLHERERKIGLRHAKICQTPLIEASGTSFFVQVNDIPIFSSGSNWCPADHFVPRVTNEKYRKLLEMFVQANQNMIRVWGGGVYEEDIFYDICDELGILVWNDFMLACGTFPADKSFLDTIAAEADDNLRRLRHHPSIVAWSGNNEDYLFATLFKTQYDINDKDPENWLKTNFPSRYIYEKLLPELCEKLIPATSYHPGSPWGGKSFNDPTIGDTHMWEVWHASSKPYQDYPKLGSRFISEFGISSLPHIKTIESYLVESSLSERHPHSRTVDSHNKETLHERKLATYLVENFRYNYGLEEYIYISQLLQAEAMTCAMRAWRREWKGPGREYCGGSLIWQFNPTWQVTSKALVDHFYRPKMAYFTVKRDIAPVSLGLERKTIKHPRFKYTRAFIDNETRILGWATNVTLKSVTYTLIIKAFELRTGKEIFEKTKAKELSSNMTTELFDIELPTTMGGPEEAVIISSSLVNDDGVVIARCTNWPQPYKYLDMPKADITVRVDGDKICVRTNDVPVKGLALYVEDVDFVDFEDNLLDLVPGDEQVVVANGLNGRSVTYKYYGIDF